MYKVWKFIAEIIGDIRFDKNLFKMPFVEWRPKYHLFKDEKDVEGYTRFAEMVIKSEIKPGDIILTTCNGYVSTLTIPGENSHVAMYVGYLNGRKYQCVHAIRKGVIQESIFKIARSDAFVVIRPKGISEHERKCVANSSTNYLHKEYDYFFDASKDKIYCSELPFHAYEQYLEELNLKTKKRFVLSSFGYRDTIVADDYLEGNFEIIFCSKLACGFKSIKKKHFV